VNDLLDFVWLTSIKATPLVYASLAGVLGERAGIVNIGLESMLAAGAFTAVVVSQATGSALLGLLGGVAAGALLGLVLALLATRLHVDQIVAGTGLNVAVLGAAAFGLIVVFGRPGASPDVPALGRTGEIALVAGAALATLLLHVVLGATPWGLRVRACGENPYAVRAASLDPRALRVQALVAGGALAGLGGVFLSIAELHLYSDGMTAGRGFIALAAVIFGGWKPARAALAALGFGALAALQFGLQGSGIPTELLQAFPYLVALAALGGLVGRSRAPESDGVPLAD